MAEQRGMREEILRMRSSTEARLQQEATARQSEELFREAERQREAQREQETWRLQKATYSHIRDLAAVAAKVWRDEAGITESDLTRFTLFGLRQNQLSRMSILIAQRHSIERHTPWQCDVEESRIVTDYSVFLGITGLLRVSNGASEDIAGYVVPASKLSRGVQPGDQPIIQLYANKMTTAVGVKLGGGEVRYPLELGPYTAT